MTKPKLGIIAGKGDLPGRLAKACASEGRGYFVLAIEGETDIHALENTEHAFVRLGAIGQMLDLLKQHAVEEIVMAGRIERPNLSSLRPDWAATKLLARIGSKLFSGDDALLKILIHFVEEQGFRVIGVEEVLHSLIATAGTMGKHKPDRETLDDLRKGVEILHAIGAFDIGQAIILHHGQVLGIEAAEGTDALIERCAALRPDGKGGVLVKACKPQQDRRVDLPTIGLNTIELLVKHGFSGVGVEAGRALVLDRDAMITQADRAKLFIHGIG